MPAPGAHPDAAQIVHARVAMERVSSMSPERHALAASSSAARASRSFTPTIASSST